MFEARRERKKFSIMLENREVFVDTAAEITDFSVNAQCRMPSEHPLFLSGERNDRNNFSWTGDPGHKYSNHIPAIGRKIEEAFRLSIQAV